MTRDLVIIGAGMAGLACARRLQDAGHAPLVLDKGRGIGGRMATRRVARDAGELRFDHGAQYVTARDPRFAALLRTLAAQGATAQWHIDGGARIVGLPGMSGLPAALAQGIEMRRETEVTALTQSEGGGWLLDTTGGRIAARRLVVAIPAPQAAALLGDHPLAQKLAHIVLAPCLTLMAAFPSDTPRPFTTATSATHPLAWIAQDSSKPGRPDGAASWVAQASPDWSARHLEQDRDSLAARMLPLLAERLGTRPGAALHASAHRWRYARVTTALDAPFLCDARGDLHLGGDWCLGARVEAAWQSGDAIARALLQQEAPG